MIKNLFKGARVFSRVARHAFIFFLFGTAVATVNLLAIGQALGDTPPPPVTTNISNVQRAASATGTLGVLSFKAAQDIVASTAPGKQLGGARIQRADHPTEFAGSWAQGGQLGGWLGPLNAGTDRSYSPSASLVENVYFDNELTAEAPATTVGDHLEFAMGVVPFDTPLPWRRERTSARGSLQWESTVVTQTVQSTFSGVSGEVDVVMFRADVVARGGDVDARSQPLQMEPLVIPLPRVYTGVPAYIGLSSLGKPYTNYITNVTLGAAPSVGQLVIDAEIRGYIPQAQSYTLPNGAVMKEWHLPITGVLVIDRSNSPLTPVAQAALPGGGVAFVTDAAGTRRMNVPPGRKLSVSPGASQDQASVAEEADPILVPASTADTASDRIELITAAGADHNLGQSIALELGSSGFRATLDPDFRGEQALALRSVIDERANKSYADALSVAAVQVGSELVSLDRSRLVDLRVMPFYNGGGFSAWLIAAFDEYNQIGFNASRLYPPGLLVNAVYDVGDGLFAFIEHQLFHGGVPAGGRVNTNVVLKNLDALPVAAHPLQYVELAEPGPAFLRGAQYLTEFSGTTSLFTSAEVGNHRLNSDFRTSNLISSGEVSVLRAPAPLLGRVPDSNISINGQKVTVIQKAPPSIPSAPVPLSTFRVGLADAPVRPGPNPPPLGQACAGIAVTDLPVPDAAPQSDVREAWFDADGANVYVSLRLAEVPTAPLNPLTGDRYAVTWRSDHDAYSARATLLPSGAWTFVLHFLTSGGFSTAGPLTGEVQPGPNGVIRMKLPRDFLDYEDGTLLRDTAAYAFAGTTNNLLDHAPKSSSLTFGLGGDYMVANCSVSPVPLLEVASRKLHDAAPFDVALPILGDAGIECRSGGINGEHTIVFTFENSLSNVENARVTSGAGSVVNSAIDSSDPRRYVVNLTGVTNAQTVTVNLTNVIDAAGHSSINVPVSMAVLLGDTTASGTVNSSDIGEAKANSGLGTSGGNFRTDVTVNGVINSSDIGIIKAQSGTSLPPTAD